MMQTNEGWRCPVCGAGNAPSVSQCPCAAYRAVPRYPYPTQPPQYPTIEPGLPTTTTPYFPDRFTWAGIGSASTQ